MRNWSKNFLVLLGFLFLSVCTLAQTTITSGSTVNASTIIAGNTIVIQQGGTLRMDVSRSFASITTSTTGAGTATINGTNTLTITGATNVIASSSLSTASTVVISTSTLVIDGTYVNGSMGALTATTINVNGGGTYTHAINGGTIPTASWATSSTFQLTGLTGTIPAGMGQTFGNFIWNAAGQSADLELLAPLVVAGDFTIINTNNNEILVTNSATGRSVSVTGNLIQSGGQLTVVSGTGAGTLTVSGDFSLSGGTFILKEDAGTATLNILGNFSQSGGVFDQRAATTLSTGIVTVSGDFSLSTGTYDISGVGALGTLIVSGDFFQTGGTISQTGGGGSGVINLSGNFSQTAGTITETSTGNISIVFAGGTAQTYTYGVAIR